MSQAAAERFLEKLSRDEALMSQVTGGSDPQERVAAVVELGGGSFSDVDVWSAFKEHGFTAGELSAAELDKVAGGVAGKRIKQAPWWQRAWGSIVGGGGGDGGSPDGGHGVRG